MMNLAPQGPSLKCMVQEFAVPIVVGPSRSPGPTPASQACYSVVIQWSSSLKLCSCLCPACLFCCSRVRDSPRLHQRLLSAASVVRWYRNKFCGLLATPAFSSFRGRLAATITTAFRTTKSDTLVDTARH
jgi:hypothetical protein